MVVAGTDSGQPAASTALRPTLNACSPTWETQPMMTSSTSEGSRLSREALRAIASRNNLDPSLVDDVIMGCVSQVGEQAFNVGRNAVLAAGWPESVPATTIDRQCGSSQQALHFAAQGVMSGAYDVVVAAGVEVMSRVTMGSSIGKDSGFPFGPRVMARYEPQGGLKN